ncbi:30S ribosomal protein S21, chloroplastic [Ricinus communis]|uniref:30S ribosomal protein S21, chloroplastic n=1 Tax=Ricinus communis TaxID=3988 RepID=UPI00201A7433|nr:30S ribosomal protein S21, chloroplastic [Ricinus communis]
MATSLPLTNFLSFLLPTNPPPRSTSQLSFSSPLTRSLPQNSKSKLIPLAAHDSGSLSTELSSAINPSLANANILFFRSAYNVQVIVDDNEPEERLLNRFRREVMRAGVIQECKRRRFFENKQDEKKRKTREAAKRNKKRRPQSRFTTQNKQETSTTKKDDDDGDNWELPEGDLPY